MSTTRSGTYRDKHGDLVRFVYSTDHADAPEAVHVYPFRASAPDRCMCCDDGACEQRVESSDAWERTVVIHDRPEVVH
jgi:hypothetical protein